MMRYITEIKSGKVVIHKVGTSFAGGQCSWHMWLRDEEVIPLINFLEELRNK
jgi:hypothetical protein